VSDDAERGGATARQRVADDVQRAATFALSRHRR
jgi:hypothetical protein